MKRGRVRLDSMLRKLSQSKSEAHLRRLDFKVLSKRRPFRESRISGFKVLSVVFRSTLFLQGEPPL